MYETVLLDSYPDNESILWNASPIDNSHIHDIKGDFDKAADQCDQFLYLSDRYRVLVSCTDEILDYLTVENKENWLIDKLLINFLGAFVNYKEYVRSIEAPNTERYAQQTWEFYSNHYWFRLICDIRNYSIHHTLLSKDYTKDDAFICIDDLLTLLKHLRFSNAKQRTQRDNFVMALTNIDDSVCKVYYGTKYISIKRLIMKAQIEIEAMHTTVMDMAFQDFAKPGISWLLSHIYYTNGALQYTIIRNETKNDFVCVNEALEVFLDFLMDSLSKSHEMKTKIEGLLQDYHYVRNSSDH